MSVEGEKQEGRYKRDEGAMVILNPIFPQIWFVSVSKCSSESHISFAAHPDPTF